jgi:hypothetical protein
MSKKSTYRVWIHVERWSEDEPIEVEASEPRSIDDEFKTLQRAERCVDRLLELWNQRCFQRLKRANKKE